MHPIPHTNRQRKPAPAGKSPRYLPLLVWCLLMGATGLVTGCKVGPDFVQPDITLPSAWSGDSQAEESGEGAPSPAAENVRSRALINWWTVFNDPTLTSLINRAVDSNLNLQMATARLRQARANRGMAGAGLGPTLDGSGSWRLGGSSAADTPTTGTFQAGFDAGWEIDIFGGNRRNVEAADAQVEAALYQRDHVMITMAAEVAINYTDLRTLQQRLRITEKNLELQQHTARLTRQRFEGGFVNGLDVANAEAQVAATGSQIPRLESSIRQTIHNISLLLALAPGDLMAELDSPAPIPGSPPLVPAGIPSDLLRRRPDIRASEAEVHGATARIGVAKGDFYPRFTLGGGLGLQSAGPDLPLNPLSLFWSMGPSVKWNLFQSKRTLSNLELQEALQEQSVLAYRQVVLQAVKEVEDALIGSAKEEEHRQQVQQALESSQKALQLATALYTEGQTDFLNVISAQRTLYQMEESLVTSTRNMTVELISLYKALGGGWDWGEEEAGREGTSP